MPAKSFWIDDWWPILLIGLLSLGLLIFCVISLLAARRKPGRRSARLFLVFPSIPVALVLIVTSAVLLFQFGSYRKLTEWEVLARIQPGTPGKYGEFKLTYTALANGQERGSRALDMFGDFWELRADVIRWKSFMRPLGFNRSLKLTRLRGVFCREQDYLEHPLTDEVIGKGTDRVWLRARQGEAPWPYCYFIDSVYTSTVRGELTSPDLYDIIGAKEGLGLRKVDY
ncbi:MAG TPA: hypothetical protein PLP42_20205 [Acidobacteriota bacterium]|nr:hypothetical protein [Acidobacteriota bacterium]